jgi:hypothetical protein
MRKLDAWRSEFGFALLLPVHLRKPIPGERFSIHDVFGSSAYTRGAEVVLGLRRVSNGFAELHFFKDRDGDLPIGEKWGLVFEREQGFRRAPEDEVDSDEVLTERLLEFVRTNPGLSTTKVTEAVEGRTQRLRDLLRHDDRFRSERKGQADLWSLTDAGNPVPGNGTGADGVGSAKDGEPRPLVGETPLGGLTGGTGSTFGPSQNGGPALPGEDGFLDFIAGVHAAGHITTAEALKREQTHKFVRRAREARRA